MVYQVKRGCRICELSRVIWMNSTINIFLFDIDGTILLSGGAGRKALDVSFEALWGVPNAMGAESPHGKTDFLICQEMFHDHLGREGTQEECDRLLEDYAAVLASEVAGSERYEVMPGVPGLLEALDGRPDVMLGLGTGNIEKGARIKLGRADLNRYFPFGGFGSDAPDRPGLIEAGFQRGEARARLKRPGAEIIRWVVGDTWRDVEAAQACGARVAAVATGGDTFEALEKTKPDYLFSDLSDAGRFLSMLNGDLSPGSPTR